MQLARNLLIDDYRKARRSVRFDPIRETSLSISDPRAPDPLHSVARHESEGMVHASLQRLTPDNRNVLVLHDLEGLALCEVAALLHIPVGTVKSRMIRGRRELARILQCPANLRNSFSRGMSARRRGPRVSRGGAASGQWHGIWGIKEELPARQVA